MKRRARSLKKSPEVARAAERLGMDEQAVLSIYEDYWGAIREYLGDAHDAGIDPRVISGCFHVYGIGKFYCFPGPKRVHIPKNKRKDI